MLQYPYLILDHDDTVVASTPSIHYRSFTDTLKKLRPEVHWSLDQFIQYNFEPGFEKMCRQILQFNDEEMKFQETNWRQWVEKLHPPMFEGMVSLLKRFKESGGTICVVSHSSADIIARDYQEQCGFVPDMIFGWELGPEKRKPQSWPLEQIMKRYDCKPQELLMVDDLKPGWQMAKRCEVPFAFAGWGNPLKEIHAFMKVNADYYLNQVIELEDILYL